MSPRELPLWAAASAALVAFTIEVDNEAEQRLAHTTTAHGAPGGRGAVWLTSLAMWFNCLRDLADADADADGGQLTVAQLALRARMETNLDGMRRWGFITIDGVGRVRRGAPRPRPGRRSALGLSERGRAAEAVWRPLPALVERRWRERFGAEAIDRLRAGLLAVSEPDELALPDFLPIGGPGRIGEDAFTPRAEDERAGDRSLPLVSLLARVLLRCALDHERESRLSVGAWANGLRVLDGDGAVAVRDLPALTGVAKETQAVLTARLQEAGCVVVEPRPDGARGRQVRLTDRGRRARDAGERRLEGVIAAWRRRRGDAVVDELDAALAPIAGNATRAGSPLFTGLAPPTGGWRASVPAPRTLPWYPMVTHRGGYPDGS